MGLAIREVPCRSDNYSYVVRLAPGNEALVVDPTSADPVLAALAQDGLVLAAVLCTHHHHDHVGGVEALLAKFGGARVYAHRTDRGRIPAQTHDVDDERAFEVAGMAVNPLHVPGHTSGALAYCVEDAVFTGDTLFVAGCGRLFEGSAAEMHRSLQKLTALPDATRVYCGHEYTSTNLRFAATAEPENAAVRRKLRWAEEQLEDDRPTVPSTIRDELETNPFLRCERPSLLDRYGPGTPAEVFAAIRLAKDSF